MLKLENVSMTVNNSNGSRREIIRDINIDFEPGKLYAITGPNGGGKTTLAKVIMGIYQHSTGHIYLNGEDISKLGVTERARRGIAYAFQQPPRFKGLNVADLIKIASQGIDGMGLRKKLRDVGLCPEDYLDRDMHRNCPGTVP